MLLSANMKNQVSLVGRTNVGKSLLFNKLVKSRKSLVVDFEGSTRDINQGLIVHQDKSIILEDTGGFPENKGNYTIMGIQVEGFASIHKIEHGSTVLKHGVSQNDIVFRHLDEMALLLADPFVINK